MKSRETQFIPKTPAPVTRFTAPPARKISRRAIGFGLAVLICALSLALNLLYSVRSHLGDHDALSTSAQRVSPNITGPSAGVLVAISEEMSSRQEDAVLQDDDEDADRSMEEHEGKEGKVERLFSEDGQRTRAWLGDADGDAKPWEGAVSKQEVKSLHYADASMDLRTPQLQGHDLIHPVAVSEQGVDKMSGDDGDGAPLEDRELRKDSEYQSPKEPTKKRSSEENATDSNSLLVTKAQESSKGSGTKALRKSILTAQEVKVLAEAEWSKATSPNPSASMNYSNFVYMMWNEESFAFSQVAHKNLETVLAILPDAKIRHFLFAPIQACGYRIADGISFVQFEQYKKRGYDINIRVINKSRGPYFGHFKDFKALFPEKEPPGSDRPATDRPGVIWWKNNMDRFPYASPKLSQIESVQPHPRDSFFMIAVHLYVTGGVYTDYTLAFKDIPVDRDEPSYSMYGDKCKRKGVQNLRRHGEYDGWDVGLSMVLVFPHESSDILRCVLEKYDKIGKGKGKELSPSERFCLRPQMKKFTFPFYGAHLADDDRWVPTKPLEQQDFERLRLGHGGCARLLLENCKLETQATLNLLVVDWGGCSGMMHRHQWGQKDLYPVKFNVRRELSVAKFKKISAAWTESPFHGLEWERPRENHTIAKLIWEQNRATRWAETSLRASLFASHLKELKAEAELSDLENVFDDSRDMPTCAARFPPCSPYFADYDLPTATADPLYPNKAINAAREKCSPVLIIPGVEKGASTYTFSLLHQHPQILPPLRGAGFKESGAYLSRLDGPKMLWEKINRFPYIRHGDPFITGDATVHNMNDKDAPMRVMRDQPNPRIIFTLREPADRAWSGYRFYWRIWYSKHVPEQSFERVVNHGVLHYSTCMNERSEQGAHHENVSLQEAYEIDGHWSCRSHRKKDLYSVVWKGVYYFPVLHWMRELGRENVLVVTKEELQDKPVEVLSTMLNFVGLCTEGLDLGAYIDMARPNRTPQRRDEQLEKYGKSPDVEQQLKDFYRPFNKKLYRLIGRRLPWQEASEV